MHENEDYCSIEARVESITPLTDTILQVFLKPNEFIPYVAGQYLKILLGENLHCYSIANAPLGSRSYELHIRHSKATLSNHQLLEEIKSTGMLTLQLPYGHCHIGQLDKAKPILFIAGGTGFAPIKAMIEQLLAEGEQRSFELYWGAHSQSDLYLDEKVKQWQKHVSHFRYHAFLSQMTQSTLATLISEQHPHDLGEWQSVLAGPFDMVYAMKAALLARGVSESDLLSDAFTL